jgi:hypothetical protein
MFMQKTFAGKTLLLTQLSTVIIGSTKDVATFFSQARYLQAQLTAAGHRVDYDTLGVHLLQALPSM